MNIMKDASFNPFLLEDLKLKYIEESQYDNILGFYFEFINTFQNLSFSDFSNEQ